ncbi:YceI family protein [Arenicella sp. 4NH20-0111]|uniref:cytochrome b/b6 domain-containing protein n=1 Tax=Arenicella sp. 4NH20-0111 TaxID=3127648 RepID=UPI003105C7FF
MNQHPTNLEAGYRPLAKTLHWLVAGLILVQYILIELAESAEHAGSVVKQLGLIANHKSVGITILILAILRLSYRLFRRPPELPSTMPAWQKNISHASHGLLYFTLFSLPITGWLMSSANAYSVSWFNLVPLPDLIVASESKADTLQWVHESLANFLAILAAIHIGAALKHHLIDRDSVLSRMLSRTSVGVFLIATVLSLLFLGNWGSAPTIKATSSVNPSTKAEASNADPSLSNLPIWNVDYQNSHVKFIGQQAGAPFTGEWKVWAATLQFDDNNLAESRFVVDINIGSVSSNDSERDGYILSDDFFDASQFPNATFSAFEFVTDPNAEQNSNTSDRVYIANGNLRIKNISHPVKLNFTITSKNKEISLIGSATLNRHQWNIGMGDWSDPTWVGSEVMVDILVKASID